MNKETQWKNIIKTMNEELHSTSFELEKDYHIRKKEDVEIDSSEHVAYLVGYMEALEFIINDATNKWSK